MALHTHLPIHKTGSELLGLVAKIHAQMPRGYKRTVGDKIISHCSEMLDLMALANATQHAQRVQHIRDILKHNRAATVWLRELFRAQGFPADYIIGDNPAQGLTLTKTAQVRMCGNSVCPPLATVLVAANLSDMSISRRKTA